MEYSIDFDPELDSQPLYQVSSSDRLMLTPFGKDTLSADYKPMINQTLNEYKRLRAAKDPGNPEGKSEEEVHAKYDSWIGSGLEKNNFNWHDWESSVFECCLQQAAVQSPDGRVPPKTRAELRNEASDLIARKQAQFGAFIAKYPIDSLHYFLDRAERVRHDQRNPANVDPRKQAQLERDLQFCQTEISYIRESIIPDAHARHIDYLKRLKISIAEKNAADIGPVKKISNHFLRAIDRAIDEHSGRINHDGLPATLVSQGTMNAASNAEAGTRRAVISGARPN